MPSAEIVYKLDVKCNPKSFCKFVNSKRRSSGYPKLLEYGSMVAEDNISTSNAFTGFFSINYSCMPYDTGTFYPYAINQLCGISFPFFRV